MTSTTSIISYIMLLLVLLAIVPIFTIMALNTLFNTGIELTIWTWLSTFWLSLLLTPQKTFNVTKKS